MVKFIEFWYSSVWCNMLTVRCSMMVYFRRLTVGSLWERVRPQSLPARFTRPRWPASCLMAPPHPSPPSPPKWPQPPGRTIKCQNLPTCRKSLSNVERGHLFSVWEPVVNILNGSYIIYGASTVMHCFIIIDWIELFVILCKKVNLHVTICAKVTITLFLFMK